MVASPMSISAVSPRPEHDQIIPKVVVEEAQVFLSEEETNQILNSLGVAPNQATPIDLGFGEISGTTPSSALNIFNLDFDGEKVARDGAQESTDLSSSSSSDETSTDESNDEDSEVFEVQSALHQFKLK